jgi:hypothetical protein
VDVRRSMALGEMARDQLALDLQTEDAQDTLGNAGENIDGDTNVPTPRSTKKPKPRQVVLYVHLSQAAVTGQDGLQLARVENTRSFVTAEQVKTWCATPGTEVVVKPVIDLAEHVHVEAYQAPKRLDEQTTLINHACVFPWCTRPARKTDSEHPVPYSQGGTTSSDNQAPVCRRHHRLKTHSTWGYMMLEAGSYLWTSPHGYQFLRDHHGTLDVSRDTRPPPTADETAPPDQ